MFAAALITCLPPRIAASEPRSLAVDLARSSGEVIGAAMACGVADERLIAVGSVILGRVWELAKSPAEAQRARRAHEAAVNRASIRASRAVATECRPAFDAFEKLEHETKDPRGSRPFAIT